MLFRKREVESWEETGPKDRALSTAWSGEGLILMMTLLGKFCCPASHPVPEPISPGATALYNLQKVEMLQLYHPVGWPPTACHYWSTWILARVSEGLVFILFNELKLEAQWPMLVTLGRTALRSAGVEESRKYPLSQNQISISTRWGDRWAQCCLLNPSIRIS